MTPIEAIQSLRDLLATIDVRRADIARAIKTTEDQWTGLGRAGGQREDHAASLLVTVAVACKQLGDFCGRVVAQVNDFNADPFGKKGE